LATNSDSTTIDTLKIGAVPLDQVSQILSRIQAKQLLTIIDACRNAGRGEKDNLLTDSFSRGFKIKRTSDSSGRPKIVLHCILATLAKGLTSGRRRNMVYLVIIC